MLNSARSSRMSSQYIWPASKEPSLMRSMYIKICQLYDKILAVRRLHRRTAETDKQREQKKQQCRMLSQKEAPIYLQRPYILSGYLVGGTASEAALRTCFGLNNETLNAWTMLPACIVAIIGLQMARQHMPSEALVFWIFLMSSVLHAPFAIRLHLNVGVSEAMRNLWRTLDIFFIFTCSVPRAAALGWYVFPTWQFSAYMALSLGIYVFNIYNCMIRRKIKDIPKSSLPQALASAVLCYSAPGIIAAVQETSVTGRTEIAFLYSVIIIFIAIAGLAYGCKLPERWAPGRFDLIGNGHQVMHVAASIEYAFELLVLWKLARQKVDAAGAY